MDNIGQFLADISQTYPVTRGVNAEKVIEDARVYLVGKLYKKELDFQKAKTLIFDNYDKRTFPEPKVLYEYLSQCEIRHYDISKEDGSLVLMILPNGTKYAFTIDPFGHTIEEIKNTLIKKYGNVQVKTYPKGSVLIGDEVITP